MNKDNWTISFLWRPESSWREVHGVLPIATIRLLDESYAYIYYEASYDDSEVRTGGRFVLTDGTNNIAITANAGWLFEDVVKFAVVYTADVGVTLYVETPAEGSLSDSNASMAFADYLSSVQFSANADAEIKGIGAYGECQIWDSSLNAANIQKIFNFDPTAPAATLIQRADKMAFARDSVRCAADFRLLAADQPESNNRLIIHRPDVIVDDVSSDTRTFRFAHNGFAYCSHLNVLYKTSDGETFSTEIDLSTLDGSDPAVDMIQGGVALEDGTLLLSTTVYNTSNGKIWRKDPSTETWSLVFALTGGYVAFFGWTGVRGSEIVIGEYASPHTYANEGKRVYYSNDSGITWTMIWQRDKEEGDNMHIHCCAFHPLHTNTIYVSFGDEEFRGIYKITCSDPDNKSSADSWSFDSIVRRIQPTSVIVYNDKLFWGNDGSGYGVLIAEHNPETETFTALFNGIPTGVDNFNSPYTSYSPGLDVWKIARIGQLFYAATATSIAVNKHLAGLYVSPDLRRWQRVWNIDGQSGVWNVGYDGSKIWLRAERSDGVSRPMSFSPPLTRNITFAACSRVVTNLYSKENSIFDTTKGDWTFTNDYDAEKCGWDDTHKLIGGGALRLVAKVGDAGYLIANGPYAELLAGERFVISLWIYIPESWAAMALSGMSPKILLWAYTSADIDWDITGSAAAATALPGQWHRCVLWGRAINNVNVRARINFGGLLDAPESADHYEVWVDAVQIVKFDDLHYSIDFQPGGTPRAAEILVASAQEVGVAEHIEKRYSSKVLVIPYNGESNLTVVLREYGTGNVLDATTGDCDDTITFAQGCIEATRHAKSGDWLVVVPATDVKTLYGTIYKLAAASVTKNSTSDLPGFLFDSKYGIVFSNTVPTFNGRVLVD